MSFWTIYFVMKASQIQGALWGVFAVMALVTVISILIAIVGSCDEDWAVEAAGAKRILRKAVWVLPTMLLVSLAMPSTKTLAVALVIPAVVNNETIQKEAGDLYNIAKKALQDAVETTEEATDKE